MLSFMKMLNNISRSQAIYRHSKVTASDLNSCHYAFIISICRVPGRSQEEIAKDLCLNKSTVARALNYLEVNGYILRTPLPTDKRQFSVHPTDKALGVLPEIRQASREWRDKLAEGISDEEMEIFNSVLERMEKRAREITQSQEAAK